MQSLPRRTQKLSVKARRSFFGKRKHLAYRLTMLTSWRIRFGKNVPFSIEDRICSYEAAQVACRLFLQFLGLRTAHKPLRLIQNRSYFATGGKSDEVKVTDLGGQFVELRKDLTAAERKLLAGVYHAASKATAHLTYGSRHGFRWQDLPAAIEVIERLLHKRLFAVVRKPMERFE